MIHLHGDEERAQSKMSEPVKISSRSSVKSTISLPQIPAAGGKVASKVEGEAYKKERRVKRDTTFNASVLSKSRKKEVNMDMRSLKSYGRSSLMSYRTGKSLLNQTVNSENKTLDNDDNKPLDTVRAIPIVEWRKISSVPETDRLTEVGDTTELVDLKKCLTCGNDKVILKLLPCLHSFCQQCLENLIQEHPSRPWFRCGLCRKQILIPSRGIEGFEDNKYFQFSQLSVTENDTCGNCSVKTPSCKCSECSLYLCSDCVYIHLNEDTTKSHYIVNVKNEMVGQSSKSAVCDEHYPFTLELFCISCSEPICGRCAIAKHANHIAEHIQVTAIDRRNELKASLSDSSTRRAMKAANDYLKTCEKEKVNFQSDVQTTVNSIQVHIQALKNELDNMGNSMIKDLIEKEVSVLGNMERNIEDAKAREKASYASIETLKQIVTRTRDLDLISKYQNLKSIITEVKASCKPPPSKLLRIKYKPLVHSLQSTIGRVHMDALLKRPVHYVEISSFQLTRHINCIYPVDNSKAWVAFKKYIQLCGKNGTFGLRLDMEESVYGMDANSGGTVFAACKSSVKVITTKMLPKFLFQLLHEPSDLKINDRDFLIISFKDAKRVAMFDTKGKVVMDLDTHNFGFRFGIRINEPWKIAISENENIFLKNFSSEAVGVFDSQCEIKSAFESNVYRYGSICCDRGLLFIADYKHDCVQIYSQEGHILQTCQTPGIIAPSSINVDKSGDLWLGSRNGHVKVYSPR